ncbi:uncharacterized protein FIESC28_05820 [Fusarium coffeatum]|uniref:Rhodopsin domain-containing protein n=1 Tax=Fusarium coffeatum TaxID=231269 RepID=A0A366RQU6_9HYPO|nr:uncharacterized protein FIESC28_05820 [Fusarium coffeatum]RBR18898.1 hypothetical protein FIESC28_05820 [Fusarium coffeatum]
MDDKATNITAEQAARSHENKSDIALGVALCCIGCGTAIAAMTQYGLGKHGWTLNLDQQVNYGRCFWISIFFYAASLYFTKMSFLFQYYRLMSVSRMRWVYIASMVVVTIWSASQIIGISFLCVPLQAVWDPRIKGKCFRHQLVMWYVNAIVHIVIDFAIIVMPLPIVWRLQLPRAQKLLLSGIFGLGFFTIAISIFRIQWLTPQKDFTWWNVTAASWSLAELVSGIACACLPTYKPLLIKLKQCVGRGDKSMRLQSRSVDASNFSKGEVPSIYTGTYGTQTNITATNVYDGVDAKRKSRKESKSSVGYLFDETISSIMTLLRDLLAAANKEFAAATNSGPYSSYEQIQLLLDVAKKSVHDLVCDPKGTFASLDLDTIIEACESGHPAIEQTWNGDMGRCTDFALRIAHRLTQDETKTITTDHTVSWKLLHDRLSITNWDCDEEIFKRVSHTEALAQDLYEVARFVPLIVHFREFDPFHFQNFDTVSVNMLGSFVDDHLVGPAHFPYGIIKWKLEDQQLILRRDVDSGDKGIIWWFHFHTEEDEEKASIEFAWFLDEYCGPYVELQWDAGDVRSFFVKIWNACTAVFGKPKVIRSLMRGH